GLTGREYEIQALDAFINAPTIEDELVSLKLAVSKVLENEYISSIEFGLGYKERDKSKSSQGYFLTLSD
ncbi:hypothetical protein V6237_20720, partial [Pseudoalteromonas carrageenovora]|uniref:hypothetical protein n=1 Tax=Pseudoalteromonas carrageenovora TaxID=227 RepID=UPI00311F4344